jgi:hypothetical protein
MIAHPDAVRSRGMMRIMSKSSLFFYFLPTDRPGP